MSDAARTSFSIAADSGSGTSKIRRVLLLISLLSQVGVGIELLLLGHTESTTQILPLAIIGLGLLTLGGFVLSGRVLALHVFRLMMLSSLAAGVAGLALHYRSNVEFELEMYPTMNGWTLFSEAVTGAIPALAPGAMIQIGLVGLAYTLGHPALRPVSAVDSVSSGEGQ